MGFDDVGFKFSEVRAIRQSCNSRQSLEVVRAWGAFKQTTDLFHRNFCHTTSDVALNQF